MYCVFFLKIFDIIKEFKLLKKLFIYGSVVEELFLSLGLLLCLIDFLVGECKFLKYVLSLIGGLNFFLEFELDWILIEILLVEIGDLYFI